MSIQTSTLSRPSSALPRKVASLSNAKYCVLEYTPQQRKQMLWRPVFASRVAPSYPAVPVPGDPHAMTVFVGMAYVEEGKSIPEFATERIPGVLVENDQFVSGYHYGVQAAYEESDDGECPLTERNITDTFLEIAADAVMLQEDAGTPAWSAGFFLGFAHGCSLIGTPAFELQMTGTSCVAVS